MTLALDTNVLVDLLRNKTPSVRERFDTARKQLAPLRLSLMVWHELIYGALVSARPDRSKRRIQLLIGDIPIEPFAEADMLAAAEVRAGLKRIGQPIGAYDALIAGQALNRGWTLVTANTREFARINGLVVEDWSLPTT